MPSCAEFNWTLRSKRIDCIRKALIDPAAQVVFTPQPTNGCSRAAHRVTAGFAALGDHLHDMSQTAPQHFVKAVTELGDNRPVQATRAIYNQQGQKVIDKGAAVTARLYERLQQHQLSEPLEGSVSVEPSVTGRELREAAMLLMAQQPFFGRMGDIARTRELLLDGIENAPLAPPVAFQLTLAREVRPVVYTQSLRCALIAGWLGCVPMATRFDVSMLATAGLVHDLGMLHIDPVLLEPREELGPEQRRQLYSHPLLAVMMLEPHHDYPRELLRAVLEHHECLDGSGYPRSIAGNAISPWGRVLSLSAAAASMFAAGRTAPELRLSLLLRMNRPRYDADLVQRLTQLLKPEWPGGEALPAGIDQPARHLSALDAALATWPAAWVASAAVSVTRQAKLAAMTEQCAQLQRTLADSGVAPEQLALLGEGTQDAALDWELSMMAREAAWQLRAITRQARRRWAAAPGEAYPEPFQSWLDACDQACEAPLKD
jgi:hypothetical protein